MTSDFFADDGLLQRLRTERETFCKQIDKRIAEVHQRILTRWTGMPTDTKKQAIAAETRRLLDRGLDKDYVQRCTARDLEATLALTAPLDRTPKTEPKIRTWYDVATDTEWSYVDAGDERSIEMRWMIGITHASKYNAIRRWQRKSKLRAEAA